MEDGKEEIEIEDDEEDEEEDPDAALFKNQTKKKEPSSEGEDEHEGGAVVAGTSKRFKTEHGESAVGEIREPVGHADDTSKTNEKKEEAEEAPAEVDEAEESLSEGSEIEENLEEPTDVMFGQYKEVKRAKSKYKCLFVDCILHSGGKDFIIKKIQADITC